MNATRSSRCVVALALLLACGLAHAELRMRAPMTYLIDYDTQMRFINHPQTIADFAQAPPDLVHVGKAVPILHNWGAVPLICGENQFTGGPGHTLNPDAIRLLTPDEVKDRIARLERFTAAWHDAGVPTLIPYTSIHTIAGDHEKRLGFWTFYDHWADYEPWLGPRPDQDPFDWLMVDRDGDFLAGACGGYSPDYYAPLHRYRVCPNHPAWQAFQQRLIRLIAAVGYDGLFVDNASPRDACFCPYCREGFKRFVAGLSKPQRECLGLAEDATDLALEDKDTPAELKRRYRIATNDAYLRMVRDAGRAVNPDFVVFPNANAYQDFMPLTEACAYFMFESSGSPGCTIQGDIPEDDHVTIRVGSDAPGDEHIEFRLAFADSRAFVELEAGIVCPKRAEVGQPATLSCAIAKVGSSDRDDDWAADFACVLTHADTGREERVALAPAGAVGGASGAQRPPVKLSAAWTPQDAGAYTVALAYRYTDPGHLATTDALARVEPLRYEHVYRTHIGELLCTMHAPGRAVLLDYDSLRGGADHLQELGLAECAAFSNGSAIASKGGPQRTFIRFFNRTRHLYEGAAPYADVALLYGYWGHNPGSMSMRPGSGEPPAERLSAQHRLIRPLVDRSLARDDLAGLKALVVCGARLELDDGQVAALRAFTDQGGRLLVYGRDCRLNGKPIQEALPQTAPWQPDCDPPGMPPLAPATGLARGLRFAAFAHRGDEPKLVLHVVNYNVAVHDEDHPVTPVHDVAIRLPLPQGWAITAVQVHDPDHDAPDKLAFRTEGQAVTFVLPQVSIYAVVELVAAA